MRVLVTGGAGFIGSHVADRLLSSGHQVAIVDSLTSGRESNMPSDAQFYKADVKDAVALNTIFKEFKPESVMHFAAQKSVTHSVKDPIDDANENVMGSLNLLEVSSSSGVKKFIFASTGGALYGETIKPASEEENPQPESPYGIAKLAVEHYLGFYQKHRNLGTVVLRLSNVYGPRQDPHGEAGVVAIFCSRLKAGQPLIIYGDGKQTRDYIYVKDVAEAFVAALRLTKSHTLNIGTGREASVLDLVDGLTAVHGEASKVQHAAERPGELRRSVLDASRAETALKWKKRYHLERGLGETYAWFAAQN